MLEVKLIIHPSWGGAPQEIADIHIVNDGTGDLVRGNYDVTITTYGTAPRSRSGRVRRGRVEGHLREAGALELVAKAILGKAGR